MPDSTTAVTRVGKARLPMIRLSSGRGTSARTLAGTSPGSSLGVPALGSPGYLRLSNRRASSTSKSLFAAPPPVTPVAPKPASGASPSASSIDSLRSPRRVEYGSVYFTTLLPGLKKTLKRYVSVHIRGKEDARVGATLVVALPVYPQH